MLSPLEQLYLETTSKEDLLAEIKDQQRIADEAKALATELNRLLFNEQAEVQRLTESNKRLTSRINSADMKLMKLRKKHGEKRETISSKIASLIINGLTDSEIIALGYKRGSITPVRSRINAIRGAS